MGGGASKSTQARPDTGAAAPFALEANPNTKVHPTPEGGDVSGSDTVIIEVEGLDLTDDHVDLLTDGTIMVRDDDE